MWQKETFLKTATLSVLVWAYPCEMKLNNENFKIAPVEPRRCCYGNIDVPILLCIWNFSYVTSMRTHFAALSWVSIMGFFMRSSAAFVLLRLLRRFVERFYLLKKLDCKNPECVNLSFKELMWRGRVLGILALATKCYKHSPSPNLKRALVENTLAENPEENRNNEKSQKCL